MPAESLGVRPFGAEWRGPPPGMACGALLPRSVASASLDCCPWGDAPPGPPPACPQRPSRSGHEHGRRAQTGHLDFYAVAGTIIPVLYIAVLLEARVFELGPVEERPYGVRRGDRIYVRGCGWRGGGPEDLVDRAHRVGQRTRAHRDCAVRARHCPGDSAPDADRRTGDGS